MSFKKILATALINVVGGETLRKIMPDVWATLQVEIEAEHEGTMSPAQLETFKKMFPWVDQETLDRLAAPAGVVGAMEEVFMAMSPKEIDRILNDHFRGR